MRGIIWPVDMNLHTQVENCSQKRPLRVSYRLGVGKVIFVTAKFLKMQKQTVNGALQLILATFPGSLLIAFLDFIKPHLLHVINIILFFLLHFYIKVDATLSEKHKI